jgi:hypothetical protein
MMTQMTMVQGMTDVVHGLLFVLVCGCRQIKGQIVRGGESGGDRHQASEVGNRCTTLGRGQMLLPGIAEPYQWKFNTAGSAETIDQ